MKTQSFRISALLLGSLMVALPAHAQQTNQPLVQQAVRPLNLNFGQSFSYDSNVLRLSDGLPMPSQFAGNSRGDWFSRTYGGVNYANNIGTQSVALNANLEYRRYSNFSLYNRTNYGLGASWQGDLDRAWYASAGVSTSAITTDLRDAFGLASNVGRTIGFNTKLGYKFTPSWSVFTAFDMSRRSNSATSLQVSDSNQRSVELGGRYDPGSGINADFFLRRRNVDFPNFQRTDASGNPLPGVYDNSFVANQMVMRVNYQPTGQSSLIGQIGYSNSRFNVLKQRDSSGVLLSLAYRYTYSDELSGGLSLSRDIAGEQVSFAAPVESTRLVLDGSWRPTGRITVGASFDTNRRRFNADPAVVLGLGGLDADRINQTSLNLRYEMLRTVFLTAGISRASRSATLVGIPYTGNLYSIGVDVKLD